MFRQPFVYGMLTGIFICSIIFIVMLANVRNEVQVLSGMTHKNLEENIHLRTVGTFNSVRVMELNDNLNNLHDRVEGLAAKSEVMETAIDPNKQRQRRILQTRDAILTTLHDGENANPIKKCQHISPWDVYRAAGWLVDYTERYGVNLNLAMAVARRESLFCQKAVSPAGAVGIMQLMPATAEHLANKIGLQLHRHKAEDNIRMGVYYLAQLMIYFKGNIELAVKAYNTGPDNVERVLAGELSDYYRETREYWKYVNKFQQEFRKVGL